MPPVGRRSTKAAARATHQVTSDAAKRGHSQSTVIEKPINKRVKTPAPSKFTKKNVVKHSENEDSSGNEVKADKNTAISNATADKKWKSWSANATSTPYPDFGHPTPRECQLAHDMLYSLHNYAVEAEFDDENTPETIPFVLDAMLVAVLSQATSWSNAKRAMNSLKATYGSVFAYDSIFSAGPEKLQDTIRCGGLHVRKTKIIFSILEDVKARYGRWNLDHLLEESDEDAMKELIRYKYIGPKSAFVVMGWCMRRNRFTVDTHVYRIAGL
jgi:endonuclease-3